MGRLLIKRVKSKKAKLGVSAGIVIHGCISVPNEFQKPTMQLRNGIQKLISVRTSCTTVLNQDLVINKIFGKKINADLINDA